MKQILKVILLLTIVNQQVAAQTAAYQWETFTDGGYTYKTVSNDPMKARFYVLKNGLTVILTVNKKEPRIQGIVAVRAGSNNDPHEHTGLAHYLEHMMFKGTDKYGTLNWEKEKPYLQSIDSLYEVYNHTTDTVQRAAIYREIDKTSGEAAKYAIANEYDKMLSDMGGQNTNASTSFEVTEYEDDIPANAVEKYLSVQAERFRYPVFRLFHTELEAVYEEKNIGLDSDPDKVEESLYASLFPTSNYGLQTTIGTIENLKNPSLKEIRNYYNRNYVPNNIVIIMSGDIDPDEVIKDIAEKFDYMKPVPVLPYHSPVEAPVTAPVFKDVVGPDAENVHIGFRLPGAADTKDMVILTAIKNILSNGKAGLIDINLNKKQLVLGAGAYANSYRDYSVFTLSAKPKTDQPLEEVKDLLLSQVEKIKQGDFDESLVKATVANYKLNRMAALNDNSDRAFTLLNSFIIDDDSLWAEKVALLQRLSALTKQEIIDFANKYFGNNYVCIYKRAGEDKNVIKVTKPPITPVEVNREAQSAFLQKIESLPSASIKPQWLDYDKDIQKTAVGNTQLLYAQNKENEIFHLSYQFDMGTFNNKLLPIATQYLQYLGTDKIDAEDVSRQFYNLACSYSINTGNDVTTISISGLQENMDKAMKLLENLLANCKADDSTLTLFKQRIIKARTDNMLNKNIILSGLRSYAIYGADNPFNNQVTNDDLEKLQASNLVDLLHHLTQYQHIIIYYGPLSLQPATTLIEKNHALPTAFIPYPPEKKYIKIEQQQSKVLFADYDMVQAEIEWVHNTRNYHPAFEAVIELFNQYYSGDMSSIVFQTLRESEALAYDTYTYYIEPQKQKDKYVMLAYIGCQADKLNEAITGMNNLLDSLPRSDKELAASKSNIKKEIATERFTGDEEIYQYLADKKLGLSTDSDIRKDVYENVEGINFYYLDDFMKENISNKAYTYCILASEKKISMDDLKKYGEVKKLSLNEIFGY